MRSAFWRSLALALVVVALPSVALAGGEVSRSAMAGTNFMNTSADTWIFFHRSLDGDGFGEFVSENYQGSGPLEPGEGFGRIILPIGDDWRLGAEINDPATGSNLVDYSWNGAPYMRQFTLGGFLDGTAAGFNENAFWHGQMFTLKAARALGGGGGFSFGAGFYRDTDKDVSDTDGDGEEENKATGFNVNASWGNSNAPKTQGAFEIAGEFTQHNVESDSLGIDLSGTHFAGNARYSMSDDAHLEFAGGYLDNDFGKLFVLKGYYARDLFEEVDRGALFEVGVDYLSFEPDGADDSDNALALPTCRFSAWNEFRDNWTLYGGLVGRYFLVTNSKSDPDEAREGSGDQEFGWTAGLGWDPMDNLGLEAFLVTDNLDQILSLGNSSPLIGGIGAHATW